MPNNDVIGQIYGISVIISKKLMLRTFYFKTKKLVNYNDNSYNILYRFIYVTLL